MTVLVFERYPVEASQVAAFEAAATAAIETMRAADGNLWADVFRAADDAPSFVICSEWRTASDAASGASGATAIGDDLLRGEPTRRTFTAQR